MSVCKFCGDTIMFRVTEAGRKMPLDVKEVIIWQTNGASCMPVKGHKTHFETCKKYRRGKSEDTRKNGQTVI